MSDIIEFMKILRGVMGSHGYLYKSDIDRTIDEFEWRGRKSAEAANKSLSAAGDATAPSLGCLKCWPAQDGLPAVACREHAPSTPSTKCTWNDCMMSGFDREAAAWRARQAFLGGPTAETDPVLQDWWFRVVDAVLDVRDSRIANTATEVEPGHTESINAPSPSLDSRQDRVGALEDLYCAVAHMDWDQIRLNEGEPCFYVDKDGMFCLRAHKWAGHESGAHPFTYFSNPFQQMRDVIEEMESALAASQAECERLKRDLEQEKGAAMHAMERALAAEATIAKLKEPLTENERRRLSAVLWEDTTHDAVIREFLRLRGVES